MVNWVNNGLGSALQRWWHRLTLQSRMVSITVVSLVAVIAVFGATTAFVLNNRLMAQLDRSLISSAQSLTDTFVTSPLRLRNPNMPSNYYVHITVNGVGTDEVISNHTREVSGVPDQLTLRRVESEVMVSDPNMPVRAQTVGSSHIGVVWRMVSVPITDTQTGARLGIITVAEPLTAIRETTGNTIVFLLIFGVFVTITGGLVASYLVRRSLRPLRRIELDAGRIAGGDMSLRIEPLEAPHTEVGSLTTSLNTMLAHIESAFAAQKRSEDRVRRFVSDASHELRTPLAAIRGYGELYRMGGVPNEQVPETMGRIESEATRMGALVEDLLRLARLDEGRKIVKRPMDLVDIARNVLLNMAAVDPDHEIALSGLGGTPVPETLSIVADPDQITQVLVNLITNIQRYTPSDTPAEVSIGTLTSGDARNDSANTGMSVLIEVVDHGPGLPEEDRHRIFERFYRSDNSRSRETGGTGLGMPIVEAVAKAHGGSVEALETPGGGLTVRIVFPYVVPRT